MRPGTGHNVMPIEDPKGPLAPKASFGSDVVAETLRDLDIPYIALNPGASYRGLHDSIVNYLGNTKPQMLLCLHEEHAVHIAQGWAKVTDKAMACAVHSNVGLMHASMAIFNAWCDRMPILIMGATGYLDAARRRPWIEWIHTSRDQGALIRNYVKWDDQPGSPAAARESIVRAHWIAETTPKGPVYINLDVGLQEDPLSKDLPPIDVKRYGPVVEVAPGEAQVAQVKTLIEGSRKPVIFYGRGSRAQKAWDNRIALAERLGALIVTDLKSCAAFPSEHPLHVGVAHMQVEKHVSAVLREADLILAFDAVDLGGFLQACIEGGAPSGKVVNVSLDHRVHNGWSMDHQKLPPVDLFVSADTDLTVAALVDVLGPGQTKAWLGEVRPKTELALRAGHEQPLVRDLALSLRRSLGHRDVSLLHTTIAWHETWWPIDHPLSYLGGAGGGGLGAGPGIAVGSALALRGSGRFPVAVLGDGDFLMGATVVWTAVHYRIPLLIVVSNNASFYNDELHQERVAYTRTRPPENKWIGQKMIDPEIDLAQIATGQGAAGIGPVKTIGELGAAFARGIAIVEAGGVAVIDVRVVPGYA
ncbi:Acetolactate synthase large subunit [Beijerinckia sp. 28-YEA-48]|nr:Acetolactate synthase large subunit [Beijerinckia sp. 28-YEA-48]